MIEKYKSRRIRVAIRHLLMERWDPIGVADEPMAWDEYDGYIGRIFEMLQSHATREQIADHLKSVELDRMGFSETGKAREHRLFAAKALQKTFHEQMLID